MSVAYTHKHHNVFDDGCERSPGYTTHRWSSAFNWDTDIFMTSSPDNEPVTAVVVVAGAAAAGIDAVAAWKEIHTHALSAHD